MFFVAVISIANGHEPRKIREYLLSYLGVTFLDEYRKNYNDKIRELFWEDIKNREVYESDNLFKELIEKTDNSFLWNKIVQNMGDSYFSVWVLALKGLSETVIKNFFKIWGPQGEILYLMEAMIAIKNPRLEDIQTAQNKILDKAKELGINV